jgi:hypothetical protein
LVFTVLLLTPLAFSSARERPATEAAEELPEPGQLDVIEMTAVELDAELPEGVEASSFQWRIVEGEGGMLIRPEQPDAVFLAPRVERGVRQFVIELSVTYPEQPPSTRQLQIRVLPADPRAALEGADEQDTHWLNEFYSDVRERESERQSNSGTVAPRSNNPSVSIGVGRSSSGNWSGGVGFRWSMSYPLTQPVTVPPPGQTRQPGEGSWEAARPVPYRELSTTFPADVAERYSPQDCPLPDNEEADAEDEKADEEAEKDKSN